MEASTFFVFSCTLCLLLSSVGSDKVKYDIFWNPELTEKLSSGNVFQHNVKIGEYMDILCPQYDVDEINVMTFVIYNVTKQVFDSCGKINEDAEKLLICNKPTKCTKLTMKFQKFSPNPRGFIFIPGESYYLMAYANDNEAMTSQSNCDDKMRMEIKVHPKRHHNHNHMKRTTKHSTVVRKSPKFVKTQPYIEETTTTTTTITEKDKIDINHAGIFQGRDEPENNSFITSPNYSLIVTSLLTTIVLFIT